MFTTFPNSFHMKPNLSPSLRPASIVADCRALIASLFQITVSTDLNGNSEVTSHACGVLSNQIQRHHREL
jgi:hypothetical protein